MPHHTMMLAIAISLNSYEELIKNMQKNYKHSHCGSIWIEGGIWPLELQGLILREPSM